MNCKYFVFSKVEEMSEVYFKDKRKISGSTMEHQLSLFIPEREGGGGGGVFHLQASKSLRPKPSNLVTFAKKALAKFGISQIRDRTYVVAMVTNLSGVVQDQKQ